MQPLDPPGSVCLLFCGPVEGYSGSRWRVEEEANFLRRERGEVFARYANRYRGTPGAPRGDGNVRHGLGRVDVRERGLG